MLLVQTYETNAKGLLTMSDARSSQNIDTFHRSAIEETAGDAFDTSLLGEVASVATNLSA